MKSILVAALLVLAQHSAADESLVTIRENNRGVTELTKEKAFEAEKTFLNALAEDPFNVVLKYNLATSYLAQKKYDAAIKEYEAVLRRAELNKDLAFAAHFNAAVAAGENKNIDLALSHYQGALDLQPGSKEVKTNIELLTSGKGGGGGEGDNKNDDPKDPKGKDPGKSPQNGDKSKDKPEKPIGEKEMKNILEELGRQEQRIRALEYGDKKGAEKGPNKDW